MAFQDLRELLDVAQLQLPIGGEVYTVEACTAEDWLWFNAYSAEIDAAINTGKLNVEIEGLSQVNPEELYRRILGESFDDMVADGVTGKELSISAWTAFFWHLGNESFAEAVWVNGGKAMSGGSTEQLQEAIAKQLLPNRAARRTATKTATTKATSPRSATQRVPRATAASRKAKTTRAS